MTALTDSTQQQADTRVRTTPRLRPYRDLLIEEDWSNAEEHWQWVATADETEIVEWAEAIRRDEAETIQYEAEMIQWAEERCRDRDAEIDAL